jgi:hypothetical protein
MESAAFRKYSKERNAMMKRVLCSVLLGGALLVAAPTAAFAHDGGFDHRHHDHNYSCWSHRWGHEHHMERHFGHGWKCDRW